MSSNEHPDMSGNWADAPFVCDMCGTEFREEDAFGSVGDDEHFFCSGDCVESWEDNRSGKHD